VDPTTSTSNSRRMEESISGEDFSLAVKDPVSMEEEEVKDDDLARENPRGGATLLDVVSQDTNAFFNSLYPLHFHHG
jgi:hypothetical protein